MSYHSVPWTKHSLHLPSERPSVYINSHLGELVFDLTDLKMIQLPDSCSAS